MGPGDTWCGLRDGTSRVIQSVSTTPACRADKAHRVGSGDAGSPYRCHLPCPHTVHCLRSEGGSSAVGIGTDRHSGDRQHAGPVYFSTAVARLRPPGDMSPTPVCRQNRAPMFRGNGGEGPKLMNLILSDSRNKDDEHEKCLSSPREGFSPSSARRCSDRRCHSWGGGNCCPGGRRTSDSDRDHSHMSSLRRH